ncbi:hypothetical protein FB645_003134 [Coemansia sp. IMI 203386]|nr:hypothetical protein FB645_003134 [Coemansia sp. IMI 203386]
MKFAFAAALLASVASVAHGANENAMAQISEHWDAIVSVINADLPNLKAINTEIYNQATSVIGGTSLAADYNEELVQQVATGISPAIMNPVLERAGVTGVTLDGKPLPTAGSDEEGSSVNTEATSSDEDTAASSTPSSEESPASSPEDGAGKVAAGSLVAAVAVVAALF